MTLVGAFYRPLLLRDLRAGRWQPAEGRWLED